MTGAPVPVELALPGPEWTPVPAEEGTLFTAVRTHAVPGATGLRPTLTLTVAEAGTSSIIDLADESLATLADLGSDARLVRREVVDRDEQEPSGRGLRQVAEVTVNVEGQRLPLAHFLSVVLFTGVGPEARWAYALTLTALRLEADALGDEFARVVQSFDLSDA